MREAILLKAVTVCCPKCAWDVRSNADTDVVLTAGGTVRQNPVLAGLFLDIGKQFILKELLEKKGELTGGAFGVLRSILQ